MRIREILENRKRETVIYGSADAIGAAGVAAVLAGTWWNDGSGPLTALGTFFTIGLVLNTRLYFKARNALRCYDENPLAASIVEIQHASGEFDGK